MQAALKQTTAVLAPDPFSARRKTVSVPPGLTITQVVAHAAANDNLPPRWAMPYLRVYVGGVEVPKVWWPRTRLKNGQHVAIVCAPQGGRGGAGKVFRTLLTVAVIALTAWVGGGALAGLLGSGFAAGTVGSALAAAGVSLIGGVITNALAPSSSSNSEAASQAFSLTGARNVAKPYQPMTAVLGRRRVVPPLAAATWTETVGDDVYLRMMVQWHIGPCSLSDIKIGETPIESFEGVEMQHRLLPGDDYPSLYDSIVREESLQVFLRHADGWQQRTTQRDTTRISIDFAWPTGLAEATDNNNEAASIALQVQYRAVGAGVWINAPVGVGGVLTYTDNKSNPFRRSIAWDVAKGQYEIQIQRVTNDTTAMNVTDQVYWVALRSYGEGRPFLLDTAAITALRIKSSAQLNGVLDTLNAVVQMHAPKWDSEEGAFGASGSTRNPGEIMNWLGLGPAIARPLTDRVDAGGLGAWAERCFEKGWNCDHIIDNGGTLDQVAQIVAGTGRGFGAMWFDGKLSVAVDDQQDTPVQEFSARNVRNFTGSIAFPGALHAVNVQFQDEENGYQTATRTVFAQGYSNDNATLYETIDAPGKTNGAEAYVVGWRYLNGRLLRPEVYEFDTDLEGLVCRIGQRIQVAHYRMSVGISGARVKSLVLNDGGEVTGLWLDETVTMVDGKEYVFRAQSGAVINLLEIETAAGTSRLISFPEPLAPESAPRVGDHGIFGEAGKESLAAIVVGLGVKAGKDSHVVAIPYAPALLADGGEVPTWDPLITPRGTSPTPIGVHAPGLDRVILDKVVKDLNDERGARVEGDARPVERIDFGPTARQLMDFMGQQLVDLEKKIHAVSQAVAEADLGSVTDMQELRWTVSVVQKGVSATVDSRIMAALGPDGAIGQAITTINVALDGKASTTVTDGLTSRVTTAEGNITTLSGQYTTISGQLSNGTTGLSATYSIATGAAAQASTNAGSITSLTTQYTNLSNTIGGSYSPSSTVAAALASQASDLSATADLLDDLNASYGTSFATAKFRVSAAANKPGASATVGFSIAASDGGPATTAAFFLTTDGSTSSFWVDAEQFIVSNGSSQSALDGALEFVGGQLSVKSAAIHSLSANSIDTGTLAVNTLITNSALSKGYVGTQSGTITTDASTLTEILRLTVVALGGTTSIEAKFAQVSKADSGSYGNCAWALKAAPTPGGTASFSINSGSYFGNDSGELWRNVFGKIDGIYTYGQSIDIVLLVAGDGSKRPVIGQSQLQVICQH